MVEDEHFLDCAISGMHPMTDAENGLAVVEVLEAAQRSANEGRPIRIDELYSESDRVGGFAKHLNGNASSNGHVNGNASSNGHANGKVESVAGEAQ